jgi:hypothetical protein
VLLPAALLRRQQTGADADPEVWAAQRRHIAAMEAAQGGRAEPEPMTFIRFQRDRRKRSETQHFITRHGLELSADDWAEVFEWRFIDEHGREVHP